MKSATKRLFERFIYEFETQEMLEEGGCCSCRRPRNKFITPGMRKTLDDLREAVTQEPETIDWTRGELLETKD